MARIMIVDDALMMRTTLRRIFEKAGHEVVGEVMNGELAIGNYSHCMPDIVTMDLTMPGIGGMETIKRIMTDHPSANIIVVSALGQKHVVFEALQNGAQNYIIKPIQEEKVLSVIKLVLEQKGLATAN